MTTTNPIRRLRHAAKLSQAVLADRAGLTQGQLSQIERRPTLAGTEGGTLRKLAAALGMTIDDLLSRPSVPFAENKSRKNLER